MATVPGLINETIDEIAQCPVKYFRPSYVAERTQLPISVVFDYLLDLVKMNILHLKWEICCSEYGCNSTIQVLDKMPVPGSVVTCDFCGEDVEVTQYNLCPIFFLEKDYKADRRSAYSHIKKKAQVHFDLQLTVYLNWECTCSTFERYSRPRPPTYPKVAEYNR